MNPLQKASVRRKIMYFAAIVAIFTLSIFYRGVEGKTPSGDTYVWVPFGRDDRPTASAPTAFNRAGDWLARKTILSQARRTELRELEQGDPELAGSALRLGMLGSRGFAVTALWLAAIEKQKRNDFHEFELLVQTVTKLQPNFITPWIFQSWNIAYNVSVEQDKLNDMYYYIARGIELLAEGERRNRRSPDMRYQIAFYYQNKFGVSDKVRTLRCLFQLSCIPPAERDPDTNGLFNPADGSVNLSQFRAFCEKYPHLVRRLREQLNCKTPKDVLDFLKDNKQVPTRYKNATELADQQAQFPALPSKLQETSGEVGPLEVLGDNVSGFHAARAWYAYSLVLLPPNPKFPDGDEYANQPMPVPAPSPGEYDPFKYRVPRLPMLIIFRQGAPRAQTYQAEMEQKEGWFDDEGWRVGWPAGWQESKTLTPEWKKAAEFWWPVTGGDQQWFPREDVVLGKGTPWSRQEWEKAADLWKKHGEENGLSIPAERLAGLKNVAASDGSTLPPDPTPDQQQDAAFMKRYRANSALYYYSSHRAVTNFPSFLSSAQAEAQANTVQARKTLWQAAQARQAANKLQAIALYRDGLARWKGVLADNPDYHRNDRTDKAEEESFEYELEYLQLIAQDAPEVRAKALEEYLKDYEKKVEKAVPGMVALAPMYRPPTIIPRELQDKWQADTAEKFFSPFDGFARDGLPWVRSDVKDTVRSRTGSKVPTKGSITPTPVTATISSEPPK